MARLDKTAASLRFSGDTLDPAEISRLLGADGDVQYRKGDVMPRPGQAIPTSRKSGHWSRQAARVTPGNLDDQIAALLDPLTEDFVVWRDLSSRFRGEIFVGLFLATSNEGIAMSAQSVQKLALRGLRIDFDVYGPSAD